MPKERLRHGRFVIRLVNNLSGELDRAFCNEESELAEAVSEFALHQALVGGDAITITDTQPE